MCVRETFRSIIRVILYAHTVISGYLVLEGLCRRSNSDISSSHVKLMPSPHPARCNNPHGTKKRLLVRASRIRSFTVRNISRDMDYFLRLRAGRRRRFNNIHEANSKPAKTTEPTMSKPGVEKRNDFSWMVTVT